MEILIGFAIAALVGLTGMGGGPLAAPILMLVLGVPPAEAVGTSLLFVLFTKLAATSVYWRRGQIDYSTLRRLCVGGVPGVIVGTLFLHQMTKHPRLQPLVLTTIGLIIAVMAVLSLWRAFAQKSAQGVDRPERLPWFALPIGLEVGFSSAGAGALTSITLLHNTTLTPVTVVGTDLLFGLVLAAAGGSLHVAAGTLNGHLLLLLSTGGIAGAFCGAMLGGKLPARAIRVALSAVMAFLGQQLLWNGVTALAR
jgi:uncharacterized membrane protein YfcA